MSVASFDEVCRLAREYYCDSMRQLQLDTADRERVERARDRNPNAVDTSAWGSLAPKAKSVDATCGVIDWAAECVAWFWRFRHLGSPLTQPACVYVSSQVTADALTRYRKAGKPKEAYAFPESSFFAQDGFYNFQCKNPGKTLLDMPFWEKIAFVLNGGGHWSVLVYVRSINRLVHYDSMPGVHEGLMWEMCDLLHASGLVDRAVEPGLASPQAHQSGNWQCGWAAIARLWELGLPTSDRPTPTKTPTQADDIISSQMRTFISFLLVCNENARRHKLLYRRWQR